MKLLVAEDSLRLSADLKTYFELEKFTVDLAHDGSEAYERASSEKYSCIVLDLNLPKMDGIQVCKKLRYDGSETPIIILTARTGKQDIIDGLNCGADDYLKKPFDTEELLARVKVLVRRGFGNNTPLISVGDITVDLNSHQVFRNNEEVQLSPKEFRLLEFLLLNRGTAKDRVEILDFVWGDSDELLFSQTVDVHVAYIRKKLGKEIISTVGGKGYLVKDVQAN